MRLHIGALVVVVLVSTSLEAREWTDASGQYRREAELLGREADLVYFQDALGNRLRVGFNRLSVADQQFILASEQAGNVPANQPAVEAKTLGFRRVVASRTAAKTSDSAPAADTKTSLFKLTGWSCCTPWYCYHSCPTPIPHPPTPPLPNFGKRIYCGKWSTWHLVRLNPNLTGGTGDYLLGGPGGTVVRHLVLLKFFGLIGGDWVFQANDPTPGYFFWRFGRSVVGSCWYRVEYWNGAAWVLYEHCSVKLPV
jgi:hypothetical protein